MECMSDISQCSIMHPTAASGIIKQEAFYTIQSRSVAQCRLAKRSFPQRRHLCDSILGFLLMLEPAFQVRTQNSTLPYLSFHILCDHKTRLEIMQSRLVFLLVRENKNVGRFAAWPIPLGPILKPITDDWIPDV
jgi:hypothetical protein